MAQITPHTPHLAARTKAILPILDRGLLWKLVALWFED